MSADHLAQRLTWTRFPLQSAPGEFPSPPQGGCPIRVRCSPVCSLNPPPRHPSKRKKKRVFLRFSPFPFRFLFGPAILPDGGEEIRSPFTELFFFPVQTNGRGCKQLAKSPGLKSTRSTQQVISLFFSLFFFQ